VDRTHSLSQPFGALLILGVLLAGIARCDGPRAPERGLSDGRFAHLAVEIVRLHREHAGQPDSLSAARAALLRREGLTHDDIERFIAQRQDDPDAWEGILRAVAERLEAGANASATDSVVHRSLMIPLPDTVKTAGQP